MSKSKEDIKYATAEAKLSEDEALRRGYKGGTPLEGGKIAESEPLHLFSAAHNISSQQHKIAESQPVDLFAQAHNISSDQNQDQGSDGRTQSQPQPKPTSGSGSGSGSGEGT